MYCFSGTRKDMNYKLRRALHKEHFSLMEVWDHVGPLCKQVSAHFVFEDIHDYMYMSGVFMLPTQAAQPPSKTNS